MIYIFSFTIIYTFIKQRKKLFSAKRNLALYILLSTIGFALAVIYMINPYLPSVSLLMEKYMK
jgi:multisubunit Na+/H+ antiporter MnhB subunit